MKYSIKEYEEAISSSLSYSEAYRKLSGLSTPPNIRWFKKRVVKLELDTSHFMEKVRSGGSSKKLTFEDLLVYNRNDGRRETSVRLRRAMLEYGFTYKCSNCNNRGKWMNQKLKLEIDHIDGNSINNMPDNLRFLCPNCHSLCPTNNRKKILLPYKICECKRKINKQSTSCNSCNAKNRENPKWIDWPEDDMLHELVWKMPLNKLSTKLKVSDNSIRKRCKRNNIAMPPRGYWNRKENRIQQNKGV